MSKPRIIIAGGSGFLGRHLEKFLGSSGFEIKILTRRPKRPEEIGWDAKQPGDWCEQLDGAEVLINLTGRTVDCRYTEANKAEILNSRIESTRVLHRAIASCEQPPRIWLNSSTSTIYNDTRGEAPANTEVSDNIGSDFSMNVAKAWEQEFFSIDLPNTIQTAMRIAIVMGNDGGAFPVMSKIAKFGLCSPQGRGDQWISWIHIADFCRVVDFLHNHPLPGVVNVCAPNPIPNREFNHILRTEIRPWFSLPQPVWLLKFGAVFLRTETELILKSRKVAPARLWEAGFEFDFPSVESAVVDLLETA